ncbi:uncharacterized membrane protein YkvA (DUF1232 family) [Tamilnaduibacter salinus]|uniref:Uncharacterized membrane protein YkvA (DUF1232 family) n=1 Tax=Tamilnaduibacter salinus TaxID=1484056 RepID=A0A2U1CX10_9GAMM|nr:YkvA family protein [Tamilnaduibacter salinus]PVY76797.1 uncharacterized membrane protein YkvA (DUF1232 family) [Tamilnaduibacter salinus]
MSWFNRQRAQSELDREAGKVHPDDLGAVLEKQADIERKVQNSGRLERFSGDIRLMFDMVRDYWQGHYREIPWKSIAAVAGALVYVLNPLDLIPDLIIGFGFIDDAGVVAACLKLVESDLHRYAAWRAHRDERAS